MKDSSADKFAIGIYVAAVMVAIGIWGVIIWAIIELVAWVVSQ